MILIRRSETIPASLRDRGPAATAAMCAAIEAGDRPAFDRSIYAATDVKRELFRAQHDKCCFCETKLAHAQFGDVEHYRPKRTYYWLAYEWHNLQLACEVCNRRHKRDDFPLGDPERRITSHVLAAAVADERPIFVDPCAEDPSDYIVFRREWATDAGGSERGRATIAALGLKPRGTRRRPPRPAQRATSMVAARARLHRARP